MPRDGQVFRIRRTPKWVLIIVGTLTILAGCSTTVDPVSSEEYQQAERKLTEARASLESARQETTSAEAQLAVALTELDAVVSEHEADLSRSDELSDEIVELEASIDERRSDQIASRRAVVQTLTRQLRALQEGRFGDQ